MVRSLLVIGFSIILVGPARAQSSEAMEINHSRLDVDADGCLARADDAISGLGLSPRRSQLRGWRVAYGPGLSVVLNCMPDGERSILALGVAGGPSGGGPAARMRGDILAYLRGSSTRTEAAPRGNPPGGTTSRLLAVAKPVFSSGESVVLRWSGLPGNSKDWINVVPANEADTKWGTWWYTNGSASGERAVPSLKPGEYEARVYFNWSAGGYTVQDRLRFRVAP